METVILALRIGDPRSGQAMSPQAPNFLIALGLVEIRRCGQLWKMHRGRVIDWLWSWWHPPDLDRIVEIDLDSDLKSAYEWAGAYAPSRNGQIYEVALTHAERLYKDNVSVSDNLDKKADDLMKISGVIAGALAAAGRVSSSSVKVNFVPMVIAISCLVLTLLICARSRRPSKRVVPLTVRALLEVMETSSVPYVPSEEDEADSADESLPPLGDLWSPSPPLLLPTTSQMKAVIAASYHWANVGTQFVIEWKATQVSRATLIFCVGLLALGFAIDFFN